MQILAGVRAHYFLHSYNGYCSGSYAHNFSRDIRDGGPLNHKKHVDMCRFQF